MVPAQIGVNLQTCYFAMTPLAIGIPIASEAKDLV